MDEALKRKRTVWQLGAIALVLVIGVLVIAIPRRAGGSAGGVGKGERSVSVALAGASLGPLVPSGVASAADAAYVAAGSVPLAWQAGAGYAVASEELRAAPEVALALDAMLRDYSATNASYAIPIVTAAYTVGVSRESVYAGGYSLELGLLVPSGDEMVAAPLTGAMASAFRAWLVSHAAYYGFILSGAGQLSYVGTPHAAYIFHESIDLAAYVRLVKGKTRKAPLVVETGGVYYEIFYQPADGGRATVKLPEGAVFTASGTGDGFIVTLVRTDP